MEKIVVSIQNGLLAEAISQMLTESGEFQPFRVPVGDKKADLVDNCVMMQANILLAEVSYASGTTMDRRLPEVKELRSLLPVCKIAFLCDENSSPEIAQDVMNAKKDGYIDAFFYSSVTAKYLVAALCAL
jgi:hypothetical protein